MSRRPSIKTRPGASAAIAVSLGLATACFDTSPIAYVPSATTTTDAAAPSDAGPAPDGDVLVAQCRDCLSSSACEASYGPCESDTKCAALLVCLTDAYCLDFSISNLADVPKCGLICALGAGIASQTDPSLYLMLPLLHCAQGMCNSVCNVPGVRKP